LPHLKVPGYATAIMALLGVLLLVGPVSASEEADALTTAIQLFNDGDYVAAQEILAVLDRSKLEPEQQALRDDYLERARVAVTMVEKAMRDLEDAEIALVGGEREQAIVLLNSVLANEYAHEGVRRAAEAMVREMEDAQPEAVAGEDEEAIEAGETPPSEVVEPAEPDAPVEPAEPEIAPEDVERARTLTVEGDEMLRVGRYDDAQQRYEQALMLVSGYPEAVSGLERLQEHRENVSGSRGESLADRLKLLDNINWQRTETEYRTSERAIRGHVQAERFEEARQVLLRARQIVEAGKQFADPVTKYESLKSELDSLTDWVYKQERDYNEDKVAMIRREIEEQRTARLREIEDNRRREVDSLMKQAMQHRKDGELEAGIKVLHQVTMIDQKYQPARWLMDDWQDTLQYRRQQNIRDDFERQTQSVLIDVEEAKIPWFEQLRYPKNWLEIISRPERNRPGFSARDSLLFGALDKPVPVDFRGVPFEQVIERLADAHRLNVTVNWNDLATANVERTIPIDLSLPNEIALKKALSEVLGQAGGGTVDLGFDVADGVITIATRRFLDQHTYGAVYDINDLLMEIPNFTDAPHTDLAEQMRQLRRETAIADRPWQYGDDDDDEPEYDSDHHSRVREIVDLIQSSIAPESWRELGGSVGSIKEFNGQLVVTQNSAVHGQIGNLLGKLREKRAIQIAVEARFLTVSSHYLEELGLDLNVVFNAGNAGYDYMPTGSPDSPISRDPVLGSTLLLPRQFSRLGFTPNTPTLGTALGAGAGAQDLAQPYLNPVMVPQGGGGMGSQATPIPVQSTSSQYTNPADLAHDIPGTFAGNTIGPALSLMGSFLDNIQVDFLLRATQADSRSSVLTAPRLVLFNGQRSWMAVTIQTNFVSQLIPQVNVGAAAQLPQTGVINAGAVLDVQAAVTADKRYVTMTLRPGVTRLNQLSTFQSSGGGTAGDAFLQLPELSTQLIKTTVSVPDGGTLLIGGQKLAAETEIEAGVPILSKIPILKRAYSSKTLVKDEQTLLILIKPTIFIQSEQEELAFPSFSGT